MTARDLIEPEGGGGIRDRLQDTSSSIYQNEMLLSLLSAAFRDIRRRVPELGWNAAGTALDDAWAELTDLANELPVQITEDWREALISFVCSRAMQVNQSNERLLKQSARHWQDYLAEFAPQ